MEQIISASTLITKKNVINRISYIPGGVSLTMADLVAGSVVAEATPISAPSSGKRTVCKQAKVLAGSSTTEFPVTEKTHVFKVGNQVCTKEGGKAYAIASITNAAGVDTITVGTAIDAVSDGFLYEAAAEAASNTSVFKNQPDAVLKNAFEVPSTTQVIFVADGLLRADVAVDAVAPAYLAKLKGIIVVKY